MLVKFWILILCKRKRVGEPEKRGREQDHKPKAINTKIMKHFKYRVPREYGRLGGARTDPLQKETEVTEAHETCWRRRNGWSLFGPQSDGVQ